MKVYQLSILIKDENGIFSKLVQLMFMQESQALKVLDRYLEKYGNKRIQGSRIDIKTVYENANDYHKI